MINIVCSDCGGEHARWRPSQSCYLCDDCYTDEMYEQDRESVEPEDWDDGSNYGDS